MKVPLPTTPQASRPGTPKNAGPSFMNCNKLQELALLIDVYSMNLETSDKILQGPLEKGIKDPNTPLVRIESSYMVLTNVRLQKAVSEYAALPPVTIPTAHAITITTPQLKITQPTPLPHLHRSQQNARKTPKVLLPPT
ncbi:hypothetical protein TNCV_4761071 [Trichonephila clavipes]|uniref:Uncharacterized protein n=1 Tax=Trichonephila clavipes TaxID=2585209 RepID=A0A8X6V3H7_TRICX|nr:hypothetical protein TNCV_4761071 [Trichonephila clavipes]